MKLINALFIVLLVSCTCLAGEYDAAKSTAGVAGKHFRWHIQKAVRTDGGPDRTMIKPVAPATGIMTGFVMVYGHAIMPPYNVQVKNGVTLINAVPVGPGTSEKDIISAQAGELLNEANKIYCERGINGNSSSVAGEILTLFQRSTGTVISAKWDAGGAPPKGVLLVFWKGNVRSPEVRFNAVECGPLPAASSGKGTKQISEARQKRDLEVYSKSLQNSLEEGKLLCFSDEGGNATLPSDTKAKLDEAMKDETLDRQALLEKVEHLGFTHPAALEVIRNYNQE